MTRWIYLVSLLCIGLSLGAGEHDQLLHPQQHPKVQMDTTLGTIILELDTQAAPKTVANFLSYVQSGFYDQTIFHRVIRGFMIQGGGLTVDMQRKATQGPIPNEADNGLKNTPGTIAMARTADPNSATSQFFINVNDNAPLNHSDKTFRGWGYCVFGHVVQGMEVVHAIERTETTIRAGYRDVPREPIFILRARLLTPDKAEPNSPVLK